MTLIQVSSDPFKVDEPFTILAFTVGEHFAMHPNIMVGEDGELELDTAEWLLHHIPSGKPVMTLHQADPIEWPGEPRALDPRSIRRFVAWLESRLDCSGPEIDYSQLSDADRKEISLFRHEPNHFTPGDAA